MLRGGRRNVVDDDPGGRVAAVELRERPVHVVTVVGVRVDGLAVGGGDDCLVVEDAVVIPVIEDDVSLPAPTRASPGTGR